MMRLYQHIAKKTMVSVMVLLEAFFLVQPAFALVPNDPRYIDQERFWNQINAPAGWEYSTGSKNVVVAVIDTGVDTSHEDIRKNLWVNKMEIPDNKKDDDHNGYVDDVNGWNFVENIPSVRPSVFETEDDKEAVRHGTIAAGLIAAEGNNGLNGTGLSWKVSLMPLRAIKSSGSGSFRDIVEAIQYATRNGADVISMSFIGEEKNTLLYESLREAYDKGIVIVTAGGNFDKSKGEEGNLDIKSLYPACLDKEDGLQENWILSVGSSDSNGLLSIFSSYGKCLDISAPGEYIYSTERYAPEFGFPDEFGGPWFGTSFATPLVAGAAALLKSIHPEWGAKEINKVLLSTADPGNPPRLNVGKALEVAMATPMKNFSDGLYFMKENELWKYSLDLVKNERVFKLPGNQLLTFQLVPNYNRDLIVLLVKRSQKYYIRTVTSSGEFVKEQQITVLKPNINSKIRLVDGKLHLISSEYRAAQKNTAVKLLNLENNKIKEKIISGKLDYWDVGAAGDVFVARIVSGNLKVETYPWSNKKKLTYIMNGFSRLYSLQINGAADVKILGKKGEMVKLVTVDLLNSTSEIRDIGKKAVGNFALKIVRLSDSKYYLPYGETGGSFLMYGGDLNPVLTAKIPALKAQNQ